MVNRSGSGNTEQSILVFSFRRELIKIWECLREEITQLIDCSNKLKYMEKNIPENPLQLSLKEW